MALSSIKLFEPAGELIPRRLLRVSLLNKNDKSPFRRRCSAACSGKFQSIISGGKMKHYKLRCGIGIFVVIFMSLVLLSEVFSADINVSDIRTLVIEKGTENYSISVQANVTNQGESKNIMITLAAVDMNGYQIKEVVLNGYIEKGKTKMFKALVEMPKQSYEDIFKWEWKANK